MRRILQKVTWKTESFTAKLRQRLGDDTLEALYIGTPYIIGALVIVSIGFGGQWATKKLYNNAGKDVIIAGTLTAPEIDLSAPEAKDLLIQSYTQLQGGAQAWTNLEVVESNGIIFNDQEHHSFMASKSKDGSVSLRVTNRSAETELSIQDGQVAWTPEPTSLEPPAYHVASIAHLTREFYNPLMEMALSHSGEILQMSEIIWQNQRVISVTIQNAAFLSDLYLKKNDLT